MIDTLFELRIQEEFDYIMEKIRDSKIHGEKIEVYDIRQLVVGAYYAGAFACESEITSLMGKVENVNKTKPR